MESEQGHAIPHSLKELLECGPDSVMKTATISQMLSKIPPLTVASFISSCAKRLACAFSYSYCNEPLRRLQDYYHPQGTDGKVEAQRGRVTRPRLHSYQTAEPGRTRTCWIPGPARPEAVSASRKTPRHKVGADKQLLSKYRDCSPNPVANFLSSWTSCFLCLVSVSKAVSGDGATCLPKPQCSGLKASPAKIHIY